MKRHVRTRHTSSTPSPRAIATGTALHTREQARRELQRPDEPATADASATEATNADKSDQTPSSGGSSGGEEGTSLSVMMEQNPLYVDEEQLLELRRRPPVAFEVRNASPKDDQVQTATKTAAKGTPRSGQSWNSPVHVPLAHRKLVQPAEIFRDDPPFRPIAPRTPKTGRFRAKSGVVTTQKPGKLTPMVSLLPEGSGQQSNGAFVQKLRERNKELFDRLQQRFATLKRVSFRESNQLRTDNAHNADSLSSTKFSGVEDAILLFLNAKHKHDVLYFKRKNGSGGNPAETAKISLGLSSAPPATGKYMPYDLERIGEAPRSGAGDYFMMTSTSIVHHSNNNDNEVSGEVIPLAQWIMESKMFSLLLAGIPLFQKFLVRKVFVGWVRMVRQTIYRDNCKQIAQSLPFARQAFVRPLLHSLCALRDIQEIRTLSLPSTRPAVDLAAVQEHQKERLATTEMKLIDAKEKLLGLMEEMVQHIHDDLEPPTNLDELYDAEAASVRTLNAKWKSAPIAAMRKRQTDIQRQKDTAVLDMSLLETYIRMMDYMFTESLYLMIIGCVEHLRGELSAEENLGAICAAVTIVGDTLELSPSLDQTKHVFLDGLARLIRLVSNFHFTKNAISWSNNRGTGVLAVVAESFESNDFAEVDLHSVLRRDPTFDEVTKKLSIELAVWFDRAAQQMLAFESLRQIYMEVQSARGYDVARGNVQIIGSAHVNPATNLSRITGVPGGELSRFLKSTSHRLNTLDRSQHACQKLQSSWKVGFLEIQCRRSISEILDLISHERNSLHDTLYRLAVEGVSECVSVLQRSVTILEDRPQLIEFFCEQMKQIRLLKDGEKQLSQNIRNVDETVRALKRVAPPLGSEVSPQYNVMHQFLSKYTTLVQSHAKFAAKVLPNITYQVNTALQKYSLRCQKLLRMYDEFSDMEEEEDMEKNVGTFQEFVRELAAIENSTKLYQEYQKMVGLKVVEIPSLAEAMAKWGEVQELVAFTVQWLAAINSMENGIFSEQNWEAHAEKVHCFLPVIRELQSRERAGFAEKMLGNIHQAVIDYLRKLSLVKEMAQPWVKIHHWKEILKLMDLHNYVSSIGVLISDGSTVTLGFLRSRDLWKYELQIREIIQKAHHDAVTEKKLHAMKERLHDATLPIIRVQESYDLDLTRAGQLLESFEDDLLTIQSLAQVTASGTLQLQLVQWRDEVRHCEEVLDKWSVVQRSRTKLSILFSLRDVQHSVTEASFEFQGMDRKWRGMMHSAKGTSSLSICLREVVTIGFLVGAQESYSKLWHQLGTYLDEKRKHFPRFNFLSDNDLFQLIMHARGPKHLPWMVSKCFRGIVSLRVGPSRRTTLRSPELTSSISVNHSGGTDEEDSKNGTAGSGDLIDEITLHGVDIDAVYGAAVGEELPIKPLRVSDNPQFWMKELDEHVRAAMVEAVNSAMDGGLVTLFEDNLEPLIKPRTTTSNQLRALSRSEGRRTSESGNSPIPLTKADAQMATEDTRGWMDYPLQVILLCVHILVTHEVSPLVRLDRTGAAWQRFWHLFQLKKSNLIEYIARRNNPRERWLASSMLTLLLNKSHGIRELYEDQPLTLVSQSAEAAATHQTGSDVSAYHYSYAAGDSFAWIRLRRFYYDPFEKKCTIHHLVKTFQYEYSFIGNYTCPVLSPVCNRTLLAMSTALSLEHGVLVHSLNSGGCTRKRTLVRELSAMVGRECIDFDYSNGLTLTHFKRILRGVLQNNSVWLSFSGIEVSTMLRVFIQEISQIVDVLRAHQDTLVLDGIPVDITNNELAIMVSCSLDYQRSHHQEVFLRLSSCFAPVSCPSVNPEIIVEALLLVNGFKDWKGLSLRLEALFCLLVSDPEPFTKDLPLSRLPLEFAIVRNVTSRLDSKSWQSAEKSLVAAIWEEVHTKVIPERRIAFLNCIRTIFPHAVDLEINGYGMLALRVPIVKSTAVNSHEQPDIAEDSAVSSESDEEDEYYELKSVKRRLESAIKTRRLSVSESYVRKLLELYQIVLKRVIIVVAGRGVCGKSTAINILSSILSDEVAVQESRTDPALNKQFRTVRLYPEAFSLNDIYGEATGDSTWDDGFFSHFFRQNCVDTASNENSSECALEHLSLSNSDSRKGSYYFSTNDNAASSSRSLAPASWIVFDGVRDAPTLLEPLRGLMEVSPQDIKRMTLPNGDQLECTQESLRIFCEVESLQQWSPGCVSRCGLIYMQTEHMVPYTLLIKSWLHQQQPQRKRTSLAHLTKFVEPTSEFVAKLMRSHLPAVLEVFKRYAPPFLKCSVTHAVGNMLQILTPLVAELAKGVVEEDAEWMADAKIIVAYAATMSLGMVLQSRARTEFHRAAIRIAPQLQEEHPIFTLDPSVTLFDVGLRFLDHRVTLFLWSRSLVEFSKPATRRSSFAYQTEIPRRTSAILRARGRIITSDDTEDVDNDEELVGDTSTITSPLSVIYVPTAVTASCSAWLKMIALAKANALVVGESGVGKTLVMENCLRELGQKERISATAVQIGPESRGVDIQRAIENGMTGKLKGAHCPGVGKRALVLLLENLNLDTQDISMQADGPCSAMIRQVTDGKGSFIKSTKEFVEFRDLAVWCSFSLSTFGYPRVSTRLMRHFHMIWMPDQSDQVFEQVVPMFTSYFHKRYEGAFGELKRIVHRLGQFPIQIYKRSKKMWKPSAVAPHLIFNIGSVLSVFISLMNVSLVRVPADPATEFEIMGVYFTLQLQRNRHLQQTYRDQLQASALRIAKKLGYSSQSLSYIRSPEEHFFADCGDTEGITRVNAQALTTMFVAGEERFHWYHSSMSKPNQPSSEAFASGPEMSSQGEQSPRSPRKGGLSVCRLFPPSMRATASSTTSAQEKALIRRSSLAMVALKTGLPDEKVTASPSFQQLQNALDIYTFLQSGVRHLLLSGSDTADRRSTTMVACGTLSFQYREVSTQLRLEAFIEHIKAIVLEAGLKATQTVMYAEFEDLSPEEVALLVYLIRQDDLPPHVYSSADKVKMHAIDHQPKVLASDSPPTRRSSFLKEMTLPTKKDKGTKRPTTHTSAHLLTIFRENVRRSLYVVLSIGCKAKLFKFMTFQPSVYYRFVVKIFPNWQNVSAEAVCNSALHEWTSLNDSAVSEPTGTLPGEAARRVLDAGIRVQLRDIMIIVHHVAESFTGNGLYHHQQLLSLTMRGRRFGAVTTQLDDVVRVFKVLFAFHHKKLEHQLCDLRKTVQVLAKRLSQTNIRVAKEETSEVLQINATQVVLETKAELASQEAIEREAKRMFLLDEERCAKIQGEIEVERASIQRELSKTLPDVQEATEALSQINKYHIVEMKSFTNPPQLVRLAMQAVCVLLDVPPTWSEALRILADIHFLDRLRTFDKDRIDPILMERVKFYVNHPDFSMENMRRASLASTTLIKWILALVRYVEAMKCVAPTQKLLEETERNFNVIEARAQAEKNKLVDIEVRLAELRTQHAQSLQREAELQRTQETRLRWKSSVASFGHVIKQWHDITRQRLEIVDQQKVNLLGDCAIVATLVVFGAEKYHEEREHLVQQCQEAIQKHFAGPLNDPYPVSPDISSMLQHWTVSGEGLAIHLRKVIVDMQDEASEALATSLFLMDQAHQVCFKIPFLLDPLDRGVSWLKQAYHGMTPSIGSTTNGSSRRLNDSNSHRPRDEVGVVVVLDAGDPQLVRAVESCLAQTPPSMILIDNASEGEETAIESVLELIVMLKEKSSCAVYFAAKSLEKAAFWTPKTWSHFAVTDFTPTQQDLDNHLLTLFCRSSGAPVQSEIESLQATLSAEKTKEEGQFQSFLANLCAASDEADKTSNAGLSSATVSILSAWISSGTGQVFNDEESMDRIAVQLTDFLSVQKNRNQLQKKLRSLYEARRKALVFARRSRAFLLAEEGMTRLNLSLHLPLSETLMNIAESLTKSLSMPVYYHGTGNAIGEAQPQEPSLTMARVATVTTSATALYVCQRLAALPTSLHRTYLLSLTLAVDEIDSKASEYSGMAQSILMEGARDRILKLCFGRNLACHHVEHNYDNTDVVKQTSQSFVEMIIDVGILVAASMSCSRNPPKRLNDELITVFFKLQQGLFHAPNDRLRTSRDALKLALYDDMADNGYDWKTYMKSSTLYADEDTKSRGQIYAKPSVKFDSITWPPWVKQNLGLLGQLQVHVCLFDSLPLRMIDEMITTQLGDEVVLHLLGVSEDGGGIVRPSLDALANTASSSTPLLILSDSSQFAVAGGSNVRQCARRHNIPAEVVASMSMSQTAIVRPSCGGIWSYRDKAIANSTENDLVARDVNALTRIREISMDPGWSIIEGAVAAPSLSVVNALRLQLTRLSDVKSTNHEFRVWLVEELVRQGRVCKNYRDLTLVPAQRLFLEPPQTLRQHYVTHLQSERERREAEKLKKKLHKTQNKEDTPSRPAPLSRHASSMLTALQRSSAEQQHVRAALWLFHSIFRLHLQDPRGMMDGGSVNAVPTDMFISQYELDRVTRLVQLHLHQRVVATTVTSPVVQSSNPSAAAAAEAQGKTLTELAALIYMGRLRGNARAPQCRELLTWCLHYDTLDLHNADQDAPLLSRILQLRERLVTTKMAPCSNLFEQLELDLVPISLQHQQRALDTSAILKSVSSIYREPPLDGSTNFFGDAAAQLLSAQECLETVTTKFPDKSCLSSSIKQLQKQQRESMVSSWGKRKPSSAVEGLDSRSPIHPPTRQGRVSTFRRQQYLLTQLQQQPTAHLIQVELPAMESYLTFVWTSAETILSLRTDSVELLSPDTMTTVIALARGELPPVWRGEATRSSGSEGFSSPTRLKPWLRWFQEAVAFFHIHQQSVLALAPIRIDSIWLPALQRPKALFFSFRHSVAVNNGIPLGKISLVVLPRHLTKAQSANSRNLQTDAQNDVLGSMVLSGLFLSNAWWNLESGTLTEHEDVVTRNSMSSLSGRYQPLPPLTMHATTRFRLPPEGLMLPSSRSAAREDPRPLPNQTETNLGFYRCPLYKSPDQLAVLENPLDFVFLPVPGEHNAGAMALQGVALFILEQHFD